MHAADVLHYMSPASMLNSHKRSGSNMKVGIENLQVLTIFFLLCVILSVVLLYRGIITKEALSMDIR